MISLTTSLHQQILLCMLNVHMHEMKLSQEIPHNPKRKCVSAWEKNGVVPRRRMELCPCMDLHYKQPAVPQATNSVTGNLQCHRQPTVTGNLECHKHTFFSPLFFIPLLIDTYFLPEISCSVSGSLNDTLLLILFFLENVPET